MESNSSLLGLLPAEIQVLIFSYVSIGDITSISVTCHYYRLNVWALIVTLDPTALQNMVVQAAEIANSPYIDDLFSEPDPRLIEISKVQQLPIFHKIFKRVSLSRRKIEKFTLHAVDGFDDIKQDFFSAIDLYPSFVQNITSLTAIEVKLRDLERFMKMTPHVRHLDWQPFNRRLDYGRLPHLTSITIRQVTISYWNSLGAALSSFPSLLSCEFVECKVPPSRDQIKSNSLVLERLAFLNCSFSPIHDWESHISAPIQLQRLIKACLPALKVLDLRGSVAMPSLCDLSQLQQEFPNLEIVLGLFDKAAPNSKYALFTCGTE